MILTTEEAFEKVVKDRKIRKQLDPETRKRTAYFRCRPEKVKLETKIAFLKRCKIKQKQQTLWEV